MGLFSAIASIGGSLFSAQSSKREAEKNRDFQEDMSNTSYQRSMADMKKAGLNPILAAKLGGASTPGGAMGNIPDLGQTMNSAMSSQAAMQQAETAGKQQEINEKKIEAEIQQITFNAEKTLHEITQIKHQTVNLAEQYKLIQAQTGKTQAEKWFKEQFISLIKSAGGDESSAMGAAVRMLMYMGGGK